MSKWTVTLRGRIDFERTITVHADTEENAGLIAEEILIDSNKSNEHQDEIDIDEIYAEPYTDPIYEIGMRVKK